MFKPSGLRPSWNGSFWHAAVIVAPSGVRLGHTGGPLRRALAKRVRRSRISSVLSIRPPRHQGMETTRAWRGVLPELSRWAGEGEGEVG
jgi:hypothetical protein